MLDDGVHAHGPVEGAALSEPTDDALLVVRGLDVSYGKTQVLFGVDMHVNRGEIVALLGTNGAGKSTLLSAICGVVPAGRGTINYDGHESAGGSRRRSSPTAS